MKNRYLSKLVGKIETKPKDYKSALNGVGGWLIIVVIFRVLTIVLSLMSIYSEIDRLKIEGFQHIFAMIMLYAYIPLEVGINIAVIVLIFKKNILFRKLFVIYLTWAFILNLAGSIYLLAEQNIFNGQIVFSIIASAGWILYMYKSKRVRNTYIYPHADFDKTEMDKVRAFSKRISS